MNIELTKQIEKSTNQIKKEFQISIDNFLKTIEGWDELTEDEKNIARIFTSITILMKIENLKNK